MTMRLYIHSQGGFTVTGYTPELDKCQSWTDIDGDGVICVETYDLNGFAFGSGYRFQIGQAVVVCDFHSDRIEIKQTINCQANLYNISPPSDKLRTAHLNIAPTQAVSTTSATTSNTTNEQIKSVGASISVIGVIGLLIYILWLAVK